MPDKKDSAAAVVPVQVTVKLQESAQGEKPPQAIAYAFSSSGRFLAQAPVDEKGNATLPVPAAQSAQEVRIVVGPKTSDRDTAFSELSRRGAPEQLFRVAAENKGLQAVFEVPPEIWRCWLRFCLVKGSLLKRLYNNGIAVDYPVCSAEVQIWEVEPILWIIAKLPDFEIDKIRQYLLNPQPLPPGPNPPDPGPELFARLGQVEVARPVQTLQTFTAASPEFEMAQRAALTGNLTSLRQVLVGIDEAAVRYLICILFPRFVTKRLIATTTTDRCGNFQDLLILSCYQSANLYFTASVQFFGFTLTIYDPAPISCYTHWNYQCGTDVTLYTNSALAPLCTPCAPIDAPEHYVLFRALGNIQLNGIYGTSTVFAGSTTSANVGEAADLYGAGIDAPFGGTILPRVEFDSSLRAFNKANYYQISYRSGTSGPFSALTAPVDRKYNHFVGTDLVTSSHNLGPQVVNGVPNLFEIPTGLPPEGDWVFPNPPIDHANAQFPTESLPSAIAGGTHGKYQLKLELFDSLGSPVNIAAAGIRYFVPTTTDPDGTIHTADAATLGLVHGNSFIMTVHVDNRHTFGDLGTPALDGNPADNCGVFRYSPGPAGTVTVPFTASHPANFATYSYRLSRGATPLTPPSVSGQVSAATNPAVISMSALSLLTQPDGTVCDVAGFAEDLYVWALATDGWNRLSEYDSSPPPRAFVLAPLK